MGRQRQDRSVHHNWYMYRQIAPPGNGLLQPWIFLFTFFFTFFTFFSFLSSNFLFFSSANLARSFFFSSFSSFSLLFLSFSEFMASRNTLPVMHWFPGWRFLFLWRFLSLTSRTGRSIMSQRSSSMMMSPDGIEMAYALGLRMLGDQ